MREASLAGMSTNIDGLRAFSDADGGPIYSRGARLKGSARPREWTNPALGPARRLGWLAAQVAIKVPASPKEREG